MDKTIKVTLTSRLLAVVSGYRITATRVLAGFLAVLLLLTDNYWTQHRFIEVLFETFGLCFATVGAFGRLWASVYISGYKVKKLAKEGPYSIVRNPLYLFSLIGAVGIALASESLLITAIVIMAFLLYYPFVVAREENRLAAKHGEGYEEYARRTPRFIPKLSLYQEPKTYVINVPKHRQALLDATFFIWIYVALQLINHAHEAGLLPILFRIP